MTYQQIPNQSNQTLNLNTQQLPSNAKIKCRVIVTGVDENNLPTEISLESDPVEIQ